MTPAATRVLRAGADILGVALDDRSVDRLGKYLEALVLWNRRTRLTSEREPEEIVAKHVVDCLALVPLLPTSGLVVDIGSGAGFPGVVLGCLRPDLDLALIESRRRRASFLRAALRATDLGRAEVIENRAEDVARTARLARRATIVTGRAVRLDLLLPLACPFLSPGGRILVMLSSRAEKAALDAAARSLLRPTGAFEYRLSKGERRLVLALTLFPGEPAC